MLIENELSYLIAGFHLDALSSALALNVDLDTTLDVAAANTYRLFSRGLRRYERAQPERLHRDFIDTGGTITIHHDHVDVALHTKTYTPYSSMPATTSSTPPSPGGTTAPNRPLRFSFPPR